MAWPDDASDLLLGPRGRRLCFELLTDSRGLLDLPMRAWHQLPAGLRADLEAAVAATRARLDPDTDLLAALVQTAGWAMYWQEPDETDRVLEHPQVREILEPIAREVADAPASTWWASPVELGSLQHVQWLGDPELPAPMLSGARSRLVEWRRAAGAEEREARARPADPTAAWSGSWWSTPAHASLVTTTRALPGLGAAGLMLVEDSPGWTTARCWPLAAQANCRVFEITGPETWVELVARYPLDVSLSRRHDWWRVTGWADGWLIPDWAAVADDFDGVHLTVAGYLTCAGRTLRVEQEATMLAGWGPDLSFWLNDVLRDAGPTTRWRSHDDPMNWVIDPEP